MPSPQLDSPHSAPAVFPVSRYRWFQTVFPTDLALATDLVPPVRAAVEPAGFIPAHRNVTSEFMFYGKSTAAQTILVTIYGVTLMGGPPAMDYRKPLLYEPISICTLTAELGTNTGVVGGYVNDTYKFCDNFTVDFALTAFGTYLQDITGRNIKSYKPNDNVNIARLCIPDFGMLHGFVVDLNPGTATAMNCLAAFWT